jgi:hypothetical protein
MCLPLLLPLPRAVQSLVVCGPELVRQRMNLLVTQRGSAWHGVVKKDDEFKRFPDIMEMPKDQLTSEGL